MANFPHPINLFNIEFYHHLNDADLKYAAYKLGSTEILLEFSKGSSSCYLCVGNKLELKSFDMKVSDIYYIGGDIDTNIGKKTRFEALWK
jgi:hypothetical protein